MPTLDILWYECLAGETTSRRPSPDAWVEPGLEDTEGDGNEERRRSFRNPLSERLRNWAGRRLQ